jgi:hypothetical protein
MKVIRGLRVLCIFLGLVAASHSAEAVRRFVPTNDLEVIETLAPRIFLSSPKGDGNLPKPLGVKAAAEAAQRAISLSRETGDPRYLGQAQALLKPWWDKPNAPVLIAVLQATIQQSRHEFDAARTLLTGTLQRELANDPARSQGWLTLATIERVLGRYEQSLVACKRVAESGALALTVYATACELEIKSLQGQHSQVRLGFSALIKQADNRLIKSWLLSLKAENEERAGSDDGALNAYEASLQVQDDTYSALAASDLLLRKNRPAAALKILEKQPASDAVIIRRAYAKKRLGDAQWKVLFAEINDRLSAMNLRGDDPRSHAREQALVNLWLKEEGASALASAQLNLTLQKEPIDWWIALQSARLLNDPNTVAQLRSQWQAIGLRDARLERPLR